MKKILSIVLPKVAIHNIISKFKLNDIAITDPIIVAIADAELLLLSKCSLAVSDLYLSALSFTPPQHIFLVTIAKIIVSIM